MICVKLALSTFSFRERLEATIESFLSNPMSKSCFHSGLWFCISKRHGSLIWRLVLLNDNMEAGIGVITLQRHLLYFFMIKVAASWDWFKSFIILWYLQNLSINL